MSSLALLAEEDVPVVLLVPPGEQGGKHDIDELLDVFVKRSRLTIKKRESRISQTSAASRC